MQNFALVIAVAFCNKIIAICCNCPILLTRIPQKHIGKVKFKILWQRIFYFNLFQPSVALHIETSQCKPNVCFYVKYNTRLRYNTTPFLLNNYLLKWDVSVPRLSAVILGPHLVGPWPPKYCKNKFMNKAYYLFKIILIQD